MDPVNHHLVWKHIDEIKQDRVILLTTHAVKEADLLADKVAIMKEGELFAWGTPLDLKAEHGITSSNSLEEVFLKVTGANVAETTNDNYFAITDSLIDKVADISTN